MQHRLGLSTPNAALETFHAPSDADRDQTDEDDNEPPQFPLPNSIQRASSAAPPPPPSFSFDAPTDDPATDDDDEELNLPSIEIEPDALTAPTSTKKRVRVKVAIEKGCSQLDWGRLQRSGADLRVSITLLLQPGRRDAKLIRRRAQGGVTQLARITPEELARHKTKEDCWQAYGGKVYNVTPFIKYHPGGVPELMRANGRDGQSAACGAHPRSVELTQDLVCRN